jgi:hypothetical protein
VHLTACAYSIRDPVYCLRSCPMMIYMSCLLHGKDVNAKRQEGTLAPGAGRASAPPCGHALRPAARPSCSHNEVTASFERIPALVQGWTQYSSSRSR